MFFIERLKSVMVLDGTCDTTYEKKGRLLGIVPQKLKIQVTRTRYISDDQSIIKSTDNTNIRVFLFFLGRYQATSPFFTSFLIQFFNMLYHAYY